MTRWLGEGRGWPGSLRFGFRRDPLTKFPVVDADQWKFVRLAYETYVTTEDRGGGGGVRAVQRTLADAGCWLSESTIKRILSDPIYVTGEYTVQRAGVEYECKPIPLDDPIPAHLFSRVQELRKLRRGKEKRNPAGFYPLNGIVEHACGRRLRARSRGRREVVTYHHYDPGGLPVPDCCRGWSINARDLEAAVIREVRRLASSHELQEQWTALARPAFAEPESVLSGDEREAVSEELRRLRETRDALEADFIRSIGKGEARGDLLMSFHKLVEGVNQQIDALKNQLQQAEALDNARRSTRPAEEAPLTNVLLDLLTEDPPDDAQLVRKRAAVLKTVLSKVVIHDAPDGAVDIELHGPLVPADAAPLHPVMPTEAVREQLVGHLGGEEVESNRHAKTRTGRPAEAVSRSDAATPTEGVSATGVTDDGEADLDTADLRVQPVNKPYLADQLDPTVALPKLRRPGRRLRPRGEPRPACNVDSRWVSPRVRTPLRRNPVL